MSNRWFFPVSVLVLPLLTGVNALAADQAPKPDAPRWLSDWEEGLKAARAGGKPLFVVFRCEH